MDISSIRKFKKFINQELIKLSPIKRNRKICFKDVIYYSCLMNANRYSYETVNNLLKIDNIINVSKNALVKKHKNISYTAFEQLNDSLLTYIYKDSKKRRFIAADGSHTTCCKQLSKEGFKLGSYDRYCKSLISSLYDVDKQIPINIGLYKKFNERDALIDQLKYLNKGDVLIMDRGYWSVDLFKRLKSEGIDAIFRLKKNYKMVKTFNKLNKNNIDDKIVNIDNKHKIRIIKYTIKKTDYYIGTTLMDNNCDVNYFKNKYWSRWDIETNFKCLKYDMSLNITNLFSENKIRQKVVIHQFIAILSGYYEDILNKSKTKYKVNRKNSINLIINKLLIILFYKKVNKKVFKYIETIFNLIKNTVIYIIKNRKYARLRKRPITDWTFNRFYKNKKR